MELWAADVVCGWNRLCLDSARPEGSGEDAVISQWRDASVVVRSQTLGGGNLDFAGALVTGADYRALGVVRSLGRRRVPVWVLRSGADMLAATSRYACRSF